jgi:transaldolase
MRLVRDRWVSGATTNPSTFATALTDIDSYDPQLAGLIAEGRRDARQLFFALALEDVRRAADVLRPLYEATSGADGYVSFQCTPERADDADGTITQAMIIWERIGRPNAMVKVPATAQAIEPVRFLTELGINVNVTLLFSVDRYSDLLAAYRTGLEARLLAGDSLDDVHSVASFFVSRVDTKIDALLPNDSPLKGKVGIANATAAFALHAEQMASPAWERLLDAGANPQRLLWASTGTKNENYSDVLYVESLVARGVVNTMPLATLNAFADHGRVPDHALDWRTGAMTLVNAALAGLHLPHLTKELEREGLAAFSHDFADALARIQQRVTHLEG